MSERAAGFYWVRLKRWPEGVWPDPEVAEWVEHGSEGHWAYVAEERDETVADILAGPLQAPSQESRTIDDVLGPEFCARQDAAVEALLVPRGGSEASPFVEGREHDFPMHQPRMGPAMKLSTLRSRARALLDGTTPGEEGGPTPGVWRWDGADRLLGANRMQVAEFMEERDLLFVLGAHALLTELAKEEA